MSDKNITVVLMKAMLSGNKVPHWLEVGWMMHGEFIGRVQKQIYVDNIISM